MNKIKRNTFLFKELSVGTIFERNENFFIKIDADYISNGIDFTELEGKCVIDVATIPNAINLTDGLAVYFSPCTEITAKYSSATICID